MGTYTSKHGNIIKNIKFSEEASNYFEGADGGAEVTVRTNAELANDDISDTMRNIQYSGFTLGNDKLYEDDFSILKLGYTNTYYFNGYKYKSTNSENWDIADGERTVAITDSTGSYLAEPILKDAFGGTAIKIKSDSEKTFTRLPYDSGIQTEPYTFSKNDLYLDDKTLIIANTGFTYHYDSADDKTTISCSKIKNNSNLNGINYEIYFKNTNNSWILLATYKDLIAGEEKILNNVGRDNNSEIRQTDNNIKIIVIYQANTLNEIHTEFYYTTVGGTVYVTLAKNITNNGYWYNKDFPMEEVTEVALTAGTQYTISNDTEKKVTFGTNNIYKYQISGDYTLESFSASTEQSSGTVNSDMTITANLHPNTCKVGLVALPLNTANWVDARSAEFPPPSINSFTIPYGTNWTNIIINNTNYTITYNNGNIYAQARAANNYEISELAASGTGEIVSDTWITAITKQILTVEKNDGVAEINLTYRNTDNEETPISITSGTSWDIEIRGNSRWNWTATASSGYIMDAGSSSGSGSGKATISPTAHLSSDYVISFSSNPSAGGTWSPDNESIEVPQNALYPYIDISEPTVTITYGKEPLITTRTKTFGANSGYNFVRLQGGSSGAITDNYNIIGITSAKTYTINSGSCKGCSITTGTGTFDTVVAIPVSLSQGFVYPINYTINTEYGDSGEVLASGSIDGESIGFLMDSAYHSEIFINATATPDSPTPTTYTISFNGDHGSWSGGTTLSDVSYGSTYTSSSIPSGATLATVTINGSITITNTFESDTGYVIDSISPASGTVMSDMTITAYTSAPTPPPTVNKVTIVNNYYTALNVYDGQDDTGILVATIGTYSSTEISDWTSGYIFINIEDSILSPYENTIDYVKNKTVTCNDDGSWSVSDN